MNRAYDIVICGAGILGASAAHYLSRAGDKKIFLLDERPPLSFTSDHSTECYRNWWPDPVMLKLINRSIDLMEELAEESGNVFRMNRRGYLYATAEEKNIPALIERSKRTSSLGAGPLRVHTLENSSYQPAPAEGYKDQPAGADLLLGSRLIQKHFPYITNKAVAALHARRAGWISAQQLGMYLLETARSRGVQFESAKVTQVIVEGGRVRGVQINNGERIDSPIFVNAAGPFIKEVGAMMGIEIPVHTELHLKAAVKDPLGVVARNAPLLIWEDAQFLEWSAEEKSVIEEDPEAKWLLESFPSGAHTRPEGAGESQMILMLWEYKTQKMEPRLPLPLDERYPEAALRGLAAMLPRMKEYFDRMPRPQLDGGYYTRTRENRPLVGALPAQGAYIIGAASGYGIMSACGLGRLLAEHIENSDLPSYAPTLELSRYQDAAYQRQLEHWEYSGQL